MPEQLEFTWDAAAQQPPAKSTPPRKEPPPPAPREEEATPSPIPSRTEIQAAADALLKELMDRTGKPILMHVTNNSSTILSSRHAKRGNGLRLSLHYMFLSAPDNVRKALAHWIDHPKAKKAGKVIDDFIRERNHQIRPKAPPTVRLRTEGRHHDLQALFDELNNRHFGGTLRCQLTWGKMPSIRRRRSIRFGSYHADRNLIRIHPLLDQDFVPHYFVKAVLYHEMLHAHLGVGEHPSGRRSIHPPRFKRIEEAYPDNERAETWMKNERNMGRLLNGRRGA